MSGLSKKIELIANVSIILVAILLGTLLLKEYRIKKSDKPTTISAGTKLALPGIDWAKSEQTLLLVLQKGCHFCADSAPFYKRLVEEFGNRGTIKLIALLPQDSGEAKEYLNELGINIDNIRTVNPSSLGVTGTPTVLLIDRSGVVKGVWVGRLPADGESEILTRLRVKSESE